MAEVSAGTWLLLALTAASTVYTIQNQPKAPKAPDFSDLQGIDASEDLLSRQQLRTQLQEEAELTELQVGESTDLKKRKRGRESLVVELEKQQAEAEDDPAGIQVGGETAGIQLDGGTKQQATQGTTSGVQI